MVAGRARVRAERPSRRATASASQRRGGAPDARALPSYAEAALAARADAPSSVAAPGHGSAERMSLRKRPTARGAAGEGGRGGEAADLAAALEHRPCRARASRRGRWPRGRGRGTSRPRGAAASGATFPGLDGGRSPAAAGGWRVGVGLRGRATSRLPLAPPRPLSPQAASLSLLLASMEPPPTSPPPRSSEPARRALLAKCSAERRLACCARSRAPPHPKTRPRRLPPPPPLTSPPPPARAATASAARSMADCEGAPDPSSTTRPSGCGKGRAATATGCPGRSACSSHLHPQRRSRGRGSHGPASRLVVSAAGGGLGGGGGGAAALSSAAAACDAVGEPRVAAHRLDERVGEERREQERA